MRERVSCRGIPSEEHNLGKYGEDHRKLKPEEVLVTADKVSGNDNSDVITHRDMRKLHSIVPLGL